jgi:hypothetical protein
VTLDQEIIEAAGIIGLVLVFVFGYFAALLPVVLALLDTPSPDIADDRAALASRIAAYRWIIILLFLLTVLVGSTIAPLSRQVIASWSSSGPFPTIRAGLLVMDFLLLTLAGTTFLLWIRMTKRLRELRSLDS